MTTYIHRCIFEDGSHYGDFRNDSPQLPLRWCPPVNISREALLVESLPPPREVELRRVRIIRRGDDVIIEWVLPAWFEIEVRGSTEQCAHELASTLRDEYMKLVAKHIDPVAATYALIQRIAYGDAKID